MLSTVSIALPIAHRSAWTLVAWLWRGDGTANRLLILDRSVQCEYMNEIIVETKARLITAYGCDMQLDAQELARIAQYTGPMEKH